MAFDQLHAETDRQLAQQRIHSDALATRAGILIAVCTLLIGPLQVGQAPLATPVIWLVAGTVIVGVLILGTCRLAPGPSPVTLTNWSNENEPNGQLLDAKILTIEANKQALGKSDLFFWIQAAGTAAIAIIVAAH